MSNVKGHTERFLFNIEKYERYENMRVDDNHEWLLCLEQRLNLLWSILKVNFQKYFITNTTYHLLFVYLEYLTSKNTKGPKISGRLLLMTNRRFALI